jgi:hypothetical protein
VLAEFTGDRVPLSIGYAQIRVLPVRSCHRSHLAASRFGTVR